MKVVGITVTQPKKDLFSPVKRYEAQMLSTNETLSEKSSGQASTIDVAHSGTNGALPMVLGSKIISSGVRGALLPLPINDTHTVLDSNYYYRIFRNEQVKFI